LESCRASLDLREGLLRKSPDRPELQRQLAESCVEVGRLLQQTESVRAALPIFTRAERLLNGALPAEGAIAPDLADAAARCLNHLGRTHLELGDLDEAEARFR